MQALCPSCNSKIVVDDAKVPERAFQVKCPKCQTAVKFPGKGAPPAASGGQETQAGDSSIASNAELRSQLMAQLRREMSLTDGSAGPSRALIAVPDKSVAGALTTVLERLGYEVDAPDDETTRLMEQGLYELVITTGTKAPQGKSETLYQRVGRLNPEGRRRVFVALVGDDFKTGDGVQAWVAMADLVINSRDAGKADSFLKNTLGEKQRLYQAFHDARRRFEASVS